MTFVYLNGQFIEEDKAYIPISDRGFLFGDGIFTTMKVEDGKPIFLLDHQRRLERLSAIMQLEKVEILQEDIIKLIEYNDAKKGTWRLRIYATRKDSFNKKSISPIGQRLITIQKHEKTKDVLGLCTYPEAVLSPVAKIKTMAYFPRHWIMQYAIAKAFDDCIITDDKKNILEASFGNIFWIENNTFCYPDIKLPYFFGITLEKFIQIAKDLNWSIQEKKISVKQLSDNSQVFFCNSLNDFLPVIQIDDRRFSRDETTEKLLFQRFSLLKQQLS